MKIIELKAYPTSFPVPHEDRVTLGIGRAVKRDAVVVKVTTDDGVGGGGESHHGRAPGAVAHLVNTTLRQLVLGMDAADVVGVPGIGVEVDEEFLVKHPVIEGPSYV
jgi:D-galactarolactone cycloisomerase